MMVEPPILPYDPSPLWPLLEELDEWRLRLDYKGPLPRAWEGRLRRDLEVEAIAASTSMEGVPVTVEEVRRILAGERLPDVSETDRELVQGYREAMRFVLRRADDPHFRWNRELIVGLHDRILAGNFGAGAGKLRTRNLYVVNSATGERVFLPPPPEHVPELVDTSCAYLEQATAHPALLAAWVHVTTAAIHPFLDGNGRTARVLASLTMFRGGFKRKEFTSLEEWWGRHRAEYYAAFRCLGDEFEPKTDVTPFVEAHVRAQLSQVRALDLRERMERRIWTVLESLIAEARLPERTANAVWDAFWGREVTAGYYQPLADVSAATATNDLRAATAAGLLTAQGERRGRRYYAGRTLYERVGRAIAIDASGPAEAARSTIVAELTNRTIRLGQRE
ncbi:MAG: Fic family protein [Chloroflexi bacterium]|nr:Fic family protein [Chloroflexota bacterium]